MSKSQDTKMPHRAGIREQRQQPCGKVSQVGSLASDEDHEGGVNRTRNPTREVHASMSQIDLLSFSCRHIRKANNRRDCRLLERISKYLALDHTRSESCKAHSGILEHGIRRWPHEAFCDETFQFGALIDIAQEVLYAPAFGSRFFEECDERRRWFLQNDVPPKLGDNHIASKPLSYRD